MIDLFTIQTLLIHFISVIALSFIYSIKSKDKELIKGSVVYSLAALLINIYSNNFSILILGVVIGVYIYKNYSNNFISYIIALTSISLINSLYSNFWYLLLANFLIVSVYFLCYSKIIFPFNSQKQIIVLDLIEFQKIKNQNTLNDKLQSFINGSLAKVEIIKIDDIREEVVIEVSYES